LAHLASLATNHEIANTDCLPAHPSAGFCVANTLDALIGFPQGSGEPEKWKKALVF